MKSHANTQVHFQFGVSVHKIFLINVFKQILTLSKDGLDKRDITILTSLQHALDVPLPVAGLS